MKTIISLILIIFSFNSFSNVDCIIYFNSYKPYNTNNLQINLKSNQRNFSYNNSALNDTFYIASIEEGIYEIEVAYIFNNEKKVSVYNFEVDVNEKSINIRIDYRTNDSSISFFNSIIVEKIYNKPKDVELVPKCGLAIDSLPEFYVVNNTNNAFYGYNWMNCFWGSLFVFRNNQWVSPFKVLACGTVESEILLPNSSTVAYIPAYINRANTYIKEPGKYKFVIQFSDKEYRKGIPSGLDNNAITFKDTWKLFEAEKEFIIRKK